MRRCLTKFSRIVECGAVQKCVHLVDLVKSFQTSIYYLLAKFGVDTAENGLLTVCQKLAKVRKNVRKNLGLDDSPLDGRRIGHVVPVVIGQET